MSTRPPLSVLVVDDDPWILACFLRIAQGLPVHLRLSITAEEGLKLVDEEVPALIISDYRLPGLDGLSFLERIHARHPAVKRILYTGEAVLRTALGVDVPVLGKPCPPDYLRELLVGVLEESA